jgi:hypothetical protein
MDDLYLEQSVMMKSLNRSLKELRHSATAYAEAERDYKILLRQESLKLRDEGMAIGMIDKCVYGIPAVAEARFKRDVAKGIYLANQEAINVFKLQIRLNDNQINREWNSKGE